MLAAGRGPWGNAGLQRVPLLPVASTPQRCPVPNLPSAGFSSSFILLVVSWVNASILRAISFAQLARHHRDPHEILPLSKLFGVPPARTTALPRLAAKPHGDPKRIFHDKFL